MPYQIGNNPSKKEKDKRILMVKKEINENIKKYYSLKFKNINHTPGVNLIETAGKYVGYKELVNATDAVLDGWWTDGRYADELSKLLTHYFGLYYAILTNSGSSANLIAFSSLTSHLLGKRQIHPGDEVITIAAAFPTTVNPIIQNGCIPVFVDIDLDTLNIDCSQLKKALSSKTKAIMIAHTQGNPFNLAKVKQFAKDHELWLIEDCCDALGAEYNNKKVGTYGDIATLSFYPAHQMTTGEGGAMLTNNPFLYRIGKSFRDWGRDCWCETGEDDACRKRFGWKFKNLPSGYDHKFVYSHLGYNLKLTDIQAAIGVAQFSRLPGFIEARQKNYKYLLKKLLKFKNYLIFQKPEPKSRPSWFGFMITLSKKCNFTLTDIVEYLNKKKIATRPLYCGNISLHPYFENVKYRKIGSLPVTNYIMNNTFWVGVHPKLTIQDMDYITDTIKEFIETSKQTA